MNQWRKIFFLIVVLGIPMLSGCDFLEQLGEAQTPILGHKTTELTKSPTIDQLLAYFCPQILDSSVCEPVFGAAPNKADLRFDFQLVFRVQNPNDLPIPTLSMLLSLEVFKDQQGSGDKLGAVCVTFCKSEDPSCQATGATDACRKSDSDGDIRSWEDVGTAAVKGLVNFAIDGPDGAYKDNGRVRMIPANGEADLKVIFSLGIDPTLNILSKVFEKYVNDAITGTKNELTIPYSFRGTVWLELPYGAGRVGVGFGPIDGNWKL